MIRLTETLAVEWAKFNINVNAIAPGAFNSEMMDGMLKRIGDITQSFRRKRLGDPAQMDSTLLYLVSPSSEFVTGTHLIVDGGITVGPRHAWDPNAGSVMAEIMGIDADQAAALRGAMKG